jgi:spore coat protein CotF
MMKHENTAPTLPEMFKKSVNEGTIMHTQVTETIIRVRVKYRLRPLRSLKDL